MNGYLNLPSDKETFCPVMIRYKRAVWFGPDHHLVSINPTVCNEAIFFGTLGRPRGSLRGEPRLLGCVPVSSLRCSAIGARIFVQQVCAVCQWFRCRGRVCARHVLQHRAPVLYGTRVCQVYRRAKPVPRLDWCGTAGVPDEWTQLQQLLHVLRRQTIVLQLCPRIQLQCQYESVRSVTMCGEFCDSRFHALASSI